MMNLIIISAKLTESPCETISFPFDHHCRKLSQWLVDTHMQVQFPKISNEHIVNFMCLGFKKTTHTVYMMTDQCTCYTRPFFSQVPHYNIISSSHSQYQEILSYGFRSLIFERHFLPLTAWKLLSEFSIWLLYKIQKQVPNISCIHFCWIYNFFKISNPACEKVRCNK